MLVLDAVPAHSVEPKHIDLTIAGQQLFQLYHHVGQELDVVLLVDLRVHVRPRIVPGRLVEPTVRICPWVQPVSGGEIESYLQACLPASSDIFPDQVPSRQGLLHSVAVLGWPEGETVVMAGSQDSISESSLLGCFQVFKRLIIRVEVLCLSVIFLTWAIYAAPAVSLDHRPGRLGAQRTVDAPVHEQSQAGFREPLGSLPGIRELDFFYRSIDD